MSVVIKKFQNGGRVTYKRLLLLSFYNLAAFPNGLMVDDCIVLLVSILVFYLKICPSRVATKNKILLGDYQRFPFFFTFT